MGSYDPNTNIIELNSTALTNIINEACAAGLSSSDAVTFTSLILVPTLVNEIEHMKFYQNVGGITGLGEGGRFLIDPLLEDEVLGRIKTSEIELEMGAICWLAFPDMSDPGAHMVDIMLLQEGGADALMKVVAQHPTYHRLGSLDPTFDRPIDERVSQIPSANRQLSNYYEEEFTRAMRSFNDRTPQERIDTVRNLLDIIDSRDHVTSQVAGKIALTTYAWLQKWHPPIFNSIPTDLAERFTSHPIFAAAPDLAARIVLEVHPDMEARLSAFNSLCRTRDDGSALDPGTSTSLAKRAKIVFE